MTEKMEVTAKNTKEIIPKLKESINAIKLIIESLLTKEETLEDEINDKFDQVVAIIEERRSCLLNQLHSRVASHREKLGKFQSKVFILSNIIIQDSQQKDLEYSMVEAIKLCDSTDKVIKDEDNPTNNKEVNDVNIL